MKLLTGKISLLFLTVVMAFGLAGTAGAVTFDLKADWSDANNPNGVWSYNKGSTPLPLQTNYDKNTVYVTNQKAWADAQFDLTQLFGGVGHVPVWMQASKDNLWAGNDVKQGDIILHPSNPGSTADPYGEGNVTWTSNLTGVATVHGNVWYTGAISGRSVDWAVSLNGTELDDGTVFYNDGNDRSNPVAFGDFIMAVNPGDVVTFEAVRTTGYVPFWIGVNLTIDVNTAPPVPLPPSAWLFGAGLLGLPLFRFCKKLG